eukprot:2681900-Alexandrium_andersonii.AAC.1
MAPRDQFQSPRKYVDQDEPLEWLDSHPSASLNDPVTDFAPKALLEDMPPPTPASQPSVGE